MSIQAKLFLVFLLTAVCLLGSLTWVLTHRSASILFDSITETMRRTLEQVASNIDHKLLSYEETANSFYLNARLQDMLLKRYADPGEAYEAYFGYIAPYSAVMQGPKDIYRVRFYSDNDTLVFSNVTKLSEPVREEDWYRSLSGRNAGFYWTRVEQVPMSDEKVFSLRTRLNLVDPGAELYLSMDIRERELLRIVEKEVQGRRMWLAFPDGTILMDSAEGTVETFRHVEELPFDDRLSGREGSWVQEDEAGTNLILYRTLDARTSIRGMKLIMQVPLGELTPQMKSLQAPAYVLLAAACLCAAIVIYMLSIGMTRRLTGLAKGMRSVHRDQFRGYVQIKGNDEISQLGVIFNEMVRKLDQMITEVYQAEIDRKEMALRTREAEFYALQAQIHPHFLFNVLNMLRGNLLERQDERNAEIVSLLARSYRFLLDDRSEMVELSRELDAVRIYLELQLRRFEHRLRYRIHLPKEAEGLVIPKCIVQPLAENAVKHGMEQRSAVTDIDIEVSRREEGWVVSVKDNGAGIEPARLHEIQGWLRNGADGADGGIGGKAEHTGHIGLRNIHDRLQLKFGSDSGLRLSSNGGCTVAELIIPFQGESHDREEEHGDAEGANRGR